MRAGSFGMTMKIMCNQLFYDSVASELKIHQCIYPMMTLTAKWIMFLNPPVKHPEEYPKEFNPIPPENPLESVTFKMLNTRVL